MWWLTWTRFQPSWICPVTSSMMALPALELGVAAAGVAAVGVAAGDLLEDRGKVDMVVAEARGDLLLFKWKFWPLQGSFTGP